MTGWQIACSACAAGWAIATISIVWLSSLSDKREPEDPREPQSGVTLPRWTIYVLAFTAMLGVSTCAAEDRVCEIAGLTAEP